MRTVSLRTVIIGIALSMAFGLGTAGCSSSKSSAAGNPCKDPQLSKLTTDVQNAVTALTSDGADLTKITSDLDASAAALRSDGTKASNKQVTAAFNGIADIIAGMSSSAKAGQAPDPNSLSDQLDKVGQQDGISNC